MSDKNTIVALATSHGESAIAVIRVSGPLSKEIAEAAFAPKLEAHPRLSRFGKYVSMTGAIIDECIYVFFKGKASYTGEDSIEISCHGNPLICNKIISDLYDRGCEAAAPGEFTRRAFLNGKIDLSQAEAVMSVISASSERALASANKLLSGELGKLVSEWSSKMLGLLAEIEAQIDFSDEGIIESDISHFKNEIDKLLSCLSNTANSARYGNLIRDGITVLILGAPNAGKSSLMNRLVGSERSIVCDEPGTTRDFISENFNIGNYRIRILDTAGLREDVKSAVEQIGIRKTMECLDIADLIVFVADSSTKEPVIPLGIMRRISPENTIVVLNKSDLPRVMDTDRFLEKFERVSISAIADSSREIVASAIIKFIEDKKIVPDKDLLIVGERQAELLMGACRSLTLAKEKISQIPLEFIAEMLRDSMENLSEIVGTFDNEKVLDKVFSNFCIGK
ncbi:MAG: tRNA uridine-5-carboxymethylaminomethyl(34) synthesis GTPase MnmE [Opitutae bacterium]|nr:tRNA uridine-5-carboxymethylaminomethyl(34) synthesis GTPase MnmE [Opitutae bacterium]